MLGKTNALATVAVKDMNAARRFYEDTLGLRREHAEGDEAVSYTAGSSSLLVYRSEFAGTNKATAVTWIVSDLEGVVQALRSKGVTFEHYDMPGVRREGDVHVAGHLRNAWFKDPEGNILALVSE